MKFFLKNEIQSVVNQIIGYKSKYNLYPNSIQCADSYYGIKSCKHWIDGSCDGHLCAESEVPKLVMDDNSNIIDGCMLEICLNIWGTSIREIQVCITKISTFLILCDLAVCLATLYVSFSLVFALMRYLQGKVFFYSILFSNHLIK